MAVYHLTPTGPDRCQADPSNPRARGCPYGNAGGPHFDSIEEAQAAYEVQMESQYGPGGFAAAARKRHESAYKAFTQMEKLERSHEAYAMAQRYTAARRAAPSRGSKGSSRSTKGKISKLAMKGGKELFKAAGPTPRNVKKFHNMLYRGALDLTGGR